MDVLVEILTNPVTFLQIGAASATIGVMFFRDRSEDKKFTFLVAFLALVTLGGTVYKDYRAGKEAINKREQHEHILKATRKDARQSREAAEEGTRKAEQLMRTFETVNINMRSELLVLAGMVGEIDPEDLRERIKALSRSEESNLDSIMFYNIARLTADLALYHSARTQAEASLLNEIQSLRQNLSGDIKSGLAATDELILQPPSITGKDLDRMQRQDSLMTARIDSAVAVLADTTRQLSREVALAKRSAEDASVYARKASSRTGLSLLTDLAAILGIGGQ